MSLHRYISELLKLWQTLYTHTRVCLYTYVYIHIFMLQNEVGIQTEIMTATKSQ